MSDSTKLEDLDDAELVRRTLDGDKRAGGVLLRRHTRAVRTVFQLNVSDPDFVDDLTQETMLGCFRRLSTLECPASFRAWVVGIAYNKLREYYRKKKRSPDRLDSDELSAFEAEGPHAQFQVIVEKHEARKLVAALRQLPLRTQQLLLHFYWDRLKRTEIAKLLGIPVGTVGSRLSYARTQLHDRMTAQERERRPLHDTTRPVEKWQLEVRKAAKAS
jgi:RNA polymerase sigma-70 factor (ECF subfamily)